MSSGREICDAEREASEVLHSLLSIERVKKPEREGPETTSVEKEVERQGTQTEFSNLEVTEDDELDWDHPTALDMENSDSEPVNTVERSRADLCKSPGAVSAKVKGTPKSKKQKVDAQAKSEEDSPQGVVERFKQGCECHDDSCFRGLNPESVYKHRLNIAELTKEEHDMYLMGVTMACMADPGVTMRRKERQRLRSQYVYHGRKVCLSAFLFLENCTLYQLKRIRKHVMTHGVTPRVHGNHGKKPHNVFSLDTYRRATEFLKSYIEKYTKSSVNLKLPVTLPPDISRKTIHNAYFEHMKKSGPPDEKVMGYSTFRHFMKEQFPNVRFCKTEIFFNSTATVSGSSGVKCSQNVSKQPSVTPTKATHEVIEVGNLLTPSHLNTAPMILSDVRKVDFGPTYILTELQPIQEFATFQPQTISVAPLPSNTTYAFTTMQ